MSYDDSPFPDEGGTAPWQGNRGKQTQGRGSAPSKKPDLGNYVEVNVRIQEFYKKYPDGRLTTTRHDLVTDPAGRPLVIVEAAAYRTADDPVPGRGSSWMVLPGKTPYTNGSELENTETSAWGRAIAALGIATDRSIASADEVRNKQDDATPVTTEGHAGASAPPDTAKPAEAVPVVPVASQTKPVAAVSAGPAKDDVAEMTAPVFLQLCRERFIPSGTISSAARSLFGEEAMSVKALSNEQRQQLWVLLSTGEVTDAATGG